MRYRDFVTSLGGRPTGLRGMYSIAEWSLSQLREKAGSDGTIEHAPGFVRIYFKMDDGNALIVGFVKFDNVIGDAFVVGDAR